MNEKENISHRRRQSQGECPFCQGKVEMSSSRQSSNVLFCLVVGRVRVKLALPVKRRRALLASNPIEE